MNTKHFLTLKDLTSDELKQLLSRATELKEMRNRGEVYEPLANKVMAMILRNHRLGRVFHLKQVWPS